MTITQAMQKTIFQNHGIKTKVIDGDLMVLDEWTVGGELFQMWVNAPTTTKALIEFLQY